MREAAGRLSMAGLRGREIVPPDLRAVRRSVKRNGVEMDARPGRRKKNSRLPARRRKVVEKSVVRRRLDSSGKLLGYTVWCEGCGCGHAFATEVQNSQGALWTFNGNMAAPSFKPSMLVTSGHYIEGHTGRCWCDVNREDPNRKHGFRCVRCHSFVTDGRIQYLDDTSHALRGQTVALKPF
jgi:hypothetical protein